MNKNNVYEVGFLVNPDLSQQEAEQTVETVKAVLTDNSAAVMSEGEVVNIELAYQIITKINSKNERFNEAYFSWVKFSLENTSEIENIKAGLDKIKKDVFRYLITKTTEDDEVTNKFLLETETEDEDSFTSEDKKNKEKIKKEIEKSEDLIVEKQKEEKEEKEENQESVENSEEEIKK